MNRLEQLKLNTEQLQTVTQMRSFAEGMLTPSLYELKNHAAQGLAINMFLTALNYSPNVIDFRGRTYNQFTSEFHQLVRKGFINGGISEFGRWFPRNWKNPELHARILDKNMARFATEWYGNGYPVNPPDWDKLQEAHDEHEKGIYHGNGLYTMMRTGIQVASVGCFVEDKNPPNKYLVGYLYQ